MDEITGRITCDKKGSDNRCSRVKIVLGGDLGLLPGQEVYILNKEMYERLVRTNRLYNSVRMFFHTVLNDGRSKKMFNLVTRTWNPVSGCEYTCVYCWARMLALTKLRDIPRYKHGFKPRFNEEELRVKFNGGFVFVSDMGDLWGSRIPSQWIRRVLEHIRKFPNTMFLFLTKNPERYHEFIDEMPENVVLGASIETNRDEYFQASFKPIISNAPLPSERYKVFAELKWPLKFLSIEPILDFDLEIFLKWVRDMEPFLVYIGYDNYNHRLPEPPLSKTKELIKKLREITIVIEKTLRPAWYEGLGKYVTETENKGEQSLKPATQSAKVRRVSRNNA